MIDKTENLVKAKRQKINVKQSGERAAGISEKDRQLYEAAKESYAAVGIDTDKAMEILKNTAISMHCWQGDDVRGFDTKQGLSGGIQATGNYPGRAGTPDELMADIDKVLSLVPGKHRLNLHASYAVFKEGQWADRDALLPEHFEKWLSFARERDIALDFNPTFFSHPKAMGLTLTNPDDEIRKFWIRHGQACLKISEYFAEGLGKPCLMNIWIPDGFKDVPADRLGPRKRYMESLDEILNTAYDKSKVYVSLESKVFGIGLESYTAGSAEFCMNYTMKRGLVPLMDNGHYHPTELVSDKISSMLLFYDKLALHITRPVRWDSDHVVLFDDETKEIAKELVRNQALDRVFLALDFFDAGINRISAWTVGMRNMQKALLYALLQPFEKMRALQDAGDWSELMALSEALKMYPYGDVWRYFCGLCGVPSDMECFEAAKAYENDILKYR